MTSMRELMRPRPCTECGLPTESAVFNPFNLDDQQHPSCFLAVCLREAAEREAG